jgi:hypothetical protein
MRGLKQRAAEKIRLALLRITRIRSAGMEQWGLCRAPPAQRPAWPPFRVRQDPWQRSFSIGFSFPSVGANRCALCRSFTKNASRLSCRNDHFKLSG